MIFVRLDVIGCSWGEMFNCPVSTCWLINCALAQVQHHVNHYHTSQPSIDQFFKDDTPKENFPTALLDDDIWLEDKTLDRQLCIHDTSQPNHLCHYPSLYANLDFAQNLPPSLTLTAAELEYDIMDLMDTDHKDIMSTTSGKDIPDLEANLKHSLHKYIFIYSIQNELMQSNVFSMMKYTFKN